MKKLFTYLLLLPFFVTAQQTLPLKSAIDSALKSNFDIQIAKNNTEINKANNTYGYAGGLPSLNANIGENNSINSLTQKQNGGIETSKNNVSSNSLNAGISANMTLFNGFKIIATKEKLNQLQKQSELLLNQQIQNTMAAVMLTYYDILRQQSYLNIIQSSLDVSTKKTEIISERYKVGMANDADLLQSQIDKNIAEQNFNTQKLIIEQAKINLLQLMGTKEFYSIVLNDTIIVDQTIQKDSILNYLENNQQYLSAEQQIKINEQIAKELGSQRYPSLKLNTGYNFQNTTNSAGLNLLNQNYGPFVGATLQIPIFNGNIYRTQQETALYNVKNAELQKENILNTLKASASKTFQSYENTLQQLVSQQNNFENAKKLVNIVVQRFQLNQATIIDIKTAQASFENAGYQLTNLLYAAKIAEIELKKLVYKLSY
ncbi:MAG: TolC family protein [Bacteroidota bacterium]